MAGELMNHTHGKHVVHPYLGYVLDVDRRAGRSELINERGFIACDDPEPAPAGEPAFRIGIFGGSVAAGFGLRGGLDRLKMRLRKSGVSGKLPIVARCLALGGHRQPQQMLGLAYVLALGERFDLVLNLDGFNDIVLPVHHNLKRDIDLHYPRDWNIHARARFSTDLLRRIGVVENLTEARRGRAMSFSTSPLVYSVTWNLIWRTLDRVLQGDITRARSEMEAAADEEMRQAAAKRSKHSKP